VFIGLFDRNRCSKGIANFETRSQAGAAISFRRAA
jgi:hypothetical protein